MKSYSERLELFNNGVMWESVDFWLSFPNHYGRISIIEWYNRFSLKTPCKLNWYNHDSGRVVESFKVSTYNTTGENTFDFYTTYTDSFGNYRCLKFTGDTEAQFDSYDYTKERLKDNRYNQISI